MNFPLSPRDNPALLEFVIPVFDEAEVLPFLLARLRSLAERLPCEVAWLFVNDGSRDATGRILAAEASRDSRIRVIEFSRNFGHQAAVTAGVDHAVGEAIVIIDSDLQDPPELVIQMLERYREGYDVVYAQRNRRLGESFFKRTTAKLFYWIMRRFVYDSLPANTGDFRLMSANAAAGLRGLRESHRFIRGMVAWLGFAQIAVNFDRQERVAGSTKYPLKKMMRFAWDGIFSFSTAPLRLASYCGLAVILAGFMVGASSAYRAVVYSDLVPGWASLVVLGCLIGGAILFCCGMIGEYCGRIYEEIKYRPLYIVRSSINVGDTRAVRIISHLPAVSRTRSAS